MMIKKTIETDLTNVLSTRHLTLMAATNSARKKPKIRGKGYISVKRHSRWRDSSVFCKYANNGGLSTTARKQTEVARRKSGPLSFL